MFCPRCGTESESSARYCVNCGAPLRREEETSRQAATFLDRLWTIVGTTRKARLLTAATAIVLVAAVVAFIALPASEEEGSAPPRDAYTRAMDQTCVAEKERIAATGREALDEGGPASAYASALVPIVAEWRLALHSTPPPPDRQALVLRLDAALRETMSEAAALARVADGGDRRTTLEQAVQVDAASSRVEEAVAALGLERCADLAIGVGRIVSR